MPGVITLGPLLIPVPPLGLVAGLFLTTWVLGRIAPLLGMDTAWAKRTAEMSILVGILTGRLWFLAIHWESYRDNPLSALYFWQPGYAPVAGIVVALTFAAWRIHRQGSLWRKQSLTMLVSGLTTIAAAFFLIVGIAQLTGGRDPIGPGTTIAEFQLQDLNGEAVRWSDVSGDVVVLNFWATWCPPCRREMPLLNTVFEDYQSRGFQVIGVAVGEPEGTVRAYIDSIGVRYPIWTDGDGDSEDRTQEIFDLYGGIGLPTTLFVDRAGVIRKRYVGELSRGFIDSQIQPLLSQAKPLPEAS